MMVFFLVTVSCWQLSQPKVEPQNQPMATPAECLMNWYPKYIAIFEAGDTFSKTSFLYISMLNFGGVVCNVFRFCKSCTILETPDENKNPSCNKESNDLPHSISCLDITTEALLSCCWFQQPSGCFRFELVAVVGVLRIFSACGFFRKSRLGRRIF